MQILSLSERQLFESYGVSYDTWQDEEQSRIKEAAKRLDDWYFHDGPHMKKPYRGHIDP